jgi:hypothetical protein
MTDRVLIPFNGSLLALTAEQFADAQTAAADLLPNAVPARGDPFEPLLDSEAAAAQLGITARLLEDYTRSGIAPHYRVGRFVRYRPSELAAHFRVAGAPVSTDSQSVRVLRRPSNQ